MKANKKTQVETYRKKAKNKLTHGDLANSLIHVAILQIEKSGSVEFALRDLAKKLGVSHAAAYRHFASKQALLEAIALQGYLKLNEYFSAVFKADRTDPIELLGHAYIDFAISHPGYYRVMFGVPLKIENNPILHGACFESFHMLVDTIGPRNKENSKKAMLAWSVVHGWTLLLLDGQALAPMAEFKLTPDEVKIFILKAIQPVLKGIAK